MVRAATKTLIFATFLLLFAAARGVAVAQPTVGAEAPMGPAISVIIDDLGNSLGEGERAVELPGPVTCAFLPYTPYSARLAQRAHEGGKQVMLHLPMESLDDRMLGPGGLTLDMRKAEFLRTLRSDLEAIPYVSGVNNHMGSMLTADPARMRWLMQDLLYRGNLFFVDSRTNKNTVAQFEAMDNGIANPRRDVFLDNVQQPEAVRRQFELLLAMARRNGTAIGIGHPHPVTLQVLEQMLPTLAAAGVRLVPVSQLIALQHEHRTRVWQAALTR